jgi:spore coat protein U-like protein
MNKFVFIFCLLLTGAASVFAANYSLQVGNVTWIGSVAGYNCFNNTAYPNTVNFTITKLANGNKSYAVTAGPSGNTGTYTRRLASGGNTLNYQLYTSSAMSFVLEAPPTANSSQVISGNSVAQSGTVIPLSFTFYIPPNQLVAPGNYSDQITMSIFNSYNDNGSPQDTATVLITAVVASTASLCLVPTGSSFNNSSANQTLDFGTLAQGQVKSCDLLVLKNTSCTVNFSSANLGVLKSTPVATSDQIPYSCTVNGSVLNLAQIASLSLPSGVSATSDGTRLPITITIGNLGNPAAGIYSDSITITVTVQ